MPQTADWRIGWKPFLYDDTVPSVRLRAVLPEASFRRAGFRTGIVPPDGDGHYDCVVFQKAYEESDLVLAKRLAGQGVRLVFDLCDNLFYDVDGDRRRVERLRRMIDLVDVVTVSVPGLAELVAPKPAFVVDDALEVPRSNPVVRVGQVGLRRVRRQRRARLRLVWFGRSGAGKLPSGISHLGRIVPELEALDRALPLQLAVISDSRPVFERYCAGARFPVRYVEWKVGSFARMFGANDICLIPVERNAFTVYKTNNRVRTSLVLGVPVVASEIPSYTEFADWILFDDWADHISTYANDRQLVHRHVEGGHGHIRRTYTTEHLVRQWNDVFRSLLGHEISSQADDVGG